ncbi:glycosyltransferase [Agarivorans sp. Alg241-V36]|uniref:glycosyltransferase n=1 Tax=Agarivorans sp. Alg241-V36 TaxID=2305992 RepID=UPI0013D566FA|nr:glycosyltransferase [Agarivorans sp. Alg241-V36]
MNLSTLIEQSEVLKQIMASVSGPVTANRVAKTLQAFLAQLDEQSSQTNDESNRIFGLVLSEVERLSNQSEDFYLCLLSIHLLYGDRKQAVEGIVEYLSRAELSVQKHWFLYWQLCRFFFVNRVMFSEEFKYHCLDRVYKKVFSKYYAELNRHSKRNDALMGAINQPAIQPRETQSSNQRIVLVTNQLLGLKHAPTLLALNMAKTYIQLGFEVSIVNLAALPSEQADVMFVGAVGFNQLEEYNGAGIDVTLLPEKRVVTRNSLPLNRIIYSGVEIPFYQLTEEQQQFTLASKLVETPPKLLMSVSDSNLFADAVARMAGESFPVITHPTSSGSPLTLFTQPLYLNHPVDGHVDSRGENALELSRSYPKPFSYKALERISVGFPEGKFLISLVGLRISEEVDQSFLDLLHNLLSSNSQIDVVVIGADAEQFAEYQIGMPERFHFVSFTSDLASLIASTDLFLNPDRMGGGTGAVMAMGAGVPVAALARAYSDVAWWVQDKFSLASIEELFEYTKRCASDREFYASQQQLAREEYQQITTRECSFKQILIDCELIEANQREVCE